MNRKILWVLVAVAVITAGSLTTAQVMKWKDRPHTPEELAYTLFGRAREGTQEPGVYSAEVTDAGEFVVKCRYSS